MFEAGKKPPIEDALQQQPLPDLLDYTSNVTSSGCGSG
jgi:hypothetical protein